MQYWKGNQMYIITSWAAITMATCMVVEGEDSLPTKCPMNTTLQIDSAEPYRLVAMASPLPLHYVGMCQQSSWHKLGQTYVNVNYMYVIYLWTCVCGRLGYISIKCLFRIISPCTLTKAKSCWYVKVEWRCRNWPQK